jgi:radical SAM protein with 4Fe4S-binding SPASM domain
MDVSLDGASQQTYEKYRVGGSFERVVNNLKKIMDMRKRFKKKLPYVTIKFLVNKYNEHEIDTIAMIARDLHVDSFALSPLLLNIKDDKQINEWLPVNSHYSYYDYTRRSKKEMQKDCNFPWLRVIINSDGGVSPCCHLFHPSTDFGNISLQNFRRIWNNELYRKARKLLKTKKNIPDRMLPCYICIQPFLSSKNRENVDLINENLTNKIVINDLVTPIQ